MSGEISGAVSADEAIAATAKAVLEVGRGWMLAPETVERAAELGLDGAFGFWVNGRAGVLGDVDADLAAAAIGFMHADTVRRHWETECKLSHAELTDAYAHRAAEWGRVQFNDTEELDNDDLERLTELANRIAAAADPSIGMLFTGWRAVHQPADAAGAAAVALNVVRELRGGAHLSAVHAVGLGPHQSIMSTDDEVRGGAPWAEHFGWPQPHPAPNPAARAEAERITSLICRPAYEALTDQERADWIHLVAAARRAIGV